MRVVALGWRFGFIPANILAFGFCLLTCCLSLGCIAVPMRAPTRINGASGTGTTKLDFIRAGTTGRDEVVQKLGWTDTGVKEETLFLGRWASSSWGVAWAIGGGYSAVTGWDRHWKTHNILIEFDEKGVVKQYGEFGDTELARHLSAWVAKDHPLDMDVSTPIEIPVQWRRTTGKYYEATLMLEKDSLGLHELKNAAYDFTISPAKISKLSLSKLVQGDSTDPHGINQTLHFTEKTKVGDKMTLRMDVPTLVILVKYLGKPGPVDVRNVTSKRESVADSPVVLEHATPGMLLDARAVPAPKYKVVNADKVEQKIAAVNALADQGYRLTLPGPLLIMRADATPPETYRYVQMSSDVSVNWLNELGAQGYRLLPGAGMMEKEPNPKNYRYMSPHDSGWTGAEGPASLSNLIGEGYRPLDTGVMGLLFVRELETEAKPMPISEAPAIDAADAMRAGNVMKQVDALAAKGYRYLGPGLPQKGGGLDALMQKCIPECEGPFEYRYFDVHDTSQLVRKLNEQGRDGFRVVANALASRPHLLERAVMKKETYAYRVLQVKDSAVVEQALNASDQEGYVPIGYVWRVGLTADAFLILEEASGTSAAQ